MMRLDRSSLASPLYPSSRSRRRFLSASFASVFELVFALSRMRTFANQNSYHHVPLRLYTAMSPRFLFRLVLAGPASKTPVFPGGLRLPLGFHGAPARGAVTNQFNVVDWASLFFHACNTKPNVFGLSRGNCREPAFPLNNVFRGLVHECLKVAIAVADKPAKLHELGSTPFSPPSAQCGPSTTQGLGCLDFTQ